MLNKYAPSVLLVVSLLSMQTYAAQPKEMAVVPEIQTSSPLTNYSPNDVGGFVAVGAGELLWIGYNVEPCILNRLCPKDPGAGVSFIERNSYEKSLAAFQETALNIRMSALFVCSAAATAGSFYTLFKDYKDGKKEPLKRSLLIAALAISAYGLLQSSEYLCQEAYNWAHFYWCESLKARA